MDQHHHSQHEQNSSLPEERFKGSHPHLEDAPSPLGAPSISGQEHQQHSREDEAQLHQQSLTGQSSDNPTIAKSNEFCVSEGQGNAGKNFSTPDAVTTAEIITDGGGQHKQVDSRHASSTTQLAVDKTSPITNTTQGPDLVQTPLVVPSTSALEPNMAKSNSAQQESSSKDGPEPRTEHIGEVCYSEGQTVSPSHGHDRPDSILSSPLTHPNGVSIFPHLSTTEQDALAQEAYTQAEESIIADSFTGSDVRDGETDGGYDSEGFSSASTSAESSVRDYMYENGRRYHRFREGTYNFPNDDVEQEREDMKHAMVKLLCSQKLHFAPIGNNPQEVLDLGTGTGIWAIESKLPGSEGGTDANLSAFVLS